MKLEVIATSLSDLKQINQSQADRIEYCVNLEVGGLTPTHQEILAFLDQAKLPVNVMVRPTSRDFYYTESEFQQMLRDVKFLSQTSANGIVVGILDYDDTIDFERMQAIMELKGDKEVTFHRAFEWVTDQKQGLKDLAKLGINSLLTSGHGQINKALPLLKELHDQHLVKIIGGSGINLANVVAISEVVDEIHVGTAIRQEPNWYSPIDVTKINQFKALIK